MPPLPHASWSSLEPEVPSPTSGIRSAIPCVLVLPDPRGHPPDPPKLEPARLPSGLFDGFHWGEGPPSQPTHPLHTRPSPPMKTGHDRTGDVRDITWVPKVGQPGSSDFADERFREVESERARPDVRLALLVEDNREVYRLKPILASRILGKSRVSRAQGIEGLLDPLLLARHRGGVLEPQ
jgi:hypothetical protein